MYARVSLKGGRMMVTQKDVHNNIVVNAIKHLKEISWKIGTVSAECLSEKDGQKMREYINVLESRIDELEQ